MQQGIRAADRTIAVLSRAYLDSVYGTAEWQEAARADPHGFQRKLIPIRVEDCPRPGYLSSVVSFDLFDCSRAEAVPRLLNTIRGATAGRAKPAQIPEFPGRLEDRPRPPRLSNQSVPPSFPSLGGPPRPPADTPAIGSTTPKITALMVHSPADLAISKRLLSRIDLFREEGLPLDLRLHQLSAIQRRSSFDKASLILIVVTRDLLSSRFATSKALKDLLRRHEHGFISVLPVIATAATWKDQVFGRLPTLPADGRSPAESKSQTEWIEAVADGVRAAALDLARKAARKSGDHVPTLPVGDSGTIRPTSPVANKSGSYGPRQILVEVFKPAGVPVVTFVEPDDFTAFRMSLAQPGIGIVLEGPSGVGKTTILDWALRQSGDRFGPTRKYSARVPVHLKEIARIPSSSHHGIVAVDDFHRLPPSLQSDLVDYMKVLADDGDSRAKLVIVGIPGTAISLVDFSFDIANRIRVFRPGRVDDRLIRELVEKGESALNLSFDKRDEIVRESSGSLITAQSLCWTLATMAHVEESLKEHRLIRTNLREARRRVTNDLRIKYQGFVDSFICLDETSEDACIDILLELGKAADGVLSLDDFRDRNLRHREAVDRLFTKGTVEQSRLDEKIGRHLFYDSRARRLIVDDPQLIFFLRQLKREDLAVIAGKRPPMRRDQIFVCYSHTDSRWLDRLLIHLDPLERRGILDIWSDQRIEPGDDWKEEILAALDRAQFAVLLVSADFIASKFIQEIELPRLLSAAENGGCRVLPVLVRASTFGETPSLSRFQHANPNGATLAAMGKEGAEQVLANLTRSILKRIESSPT